MKTTAGADTDCIICHGSGLSPHAGKFVRCPRCYGGSLTVTFASDDTEPTGTEADICRLITERQQKGRAEYGMTVRENPMDIIGWLSELRNEMLDGAIYAQRAIEELRKRPE